MNISKVIDYLNQEHGTTLSASYYAYVEVWQRWWEGFYQPFHEFKEQQADGNVLSRQLYTMKMAKKVCEDWAAILLTEKTKLVVKDKASSLFLLGSKEDEGLGGVLGENDFWSDGNALVEKAFYSGTGAFILRFKGVKPDGHGNIVPDKDARVRIEYLEADHIIPMTVESGQIVEAAFVSDVLVQGNAYIYLETHLRENGGYRITNTYFKENQGVLEKQPTPPGVAESIFAATSYPLFAIVKPNIVNNVDRATALGVSVYANAIHNLQGVDLAYNNLNRDFYLGGKKVFYNQSLVKRIAGPGGKPVTLAPDDVAQQLFMQIGGDSLPTAEHLIHEHNPELRVGENVDGIQAQLDYLSFKCGFGTKHYQFNAGQIVTATQYSGDKQELMQNASKHYITLEKALIALCRALLWAGKNVCGQNVQIDTPISVQFDTSFIEDEDTQRMRDLQEVRDGLLMPWEYRVKWYGETEVDAKARLADAPQDDPLKGIMGEEDA